MENKIYLVSQMHGKIVVNQPGLHFSRVWNNKGSKVSIDKETLEELIYVPGFRNMLDLGMLAIEEPEVRVELGLEEEGSESKKFEVLSDGAIKRLLTTAPLAEFKATCTEINKTQLENIIAFAVENEIMPSMDKNSFIQKITGRDIIKTIQIRVELENEEKMEE